MTQNAKTGALSTFFAGQGATSLPQLTDDQIAASLAQSASDGGSGGAQNYLSFSGKSGLYGLGRDKEEVDPEQIWVIDYRMQTDGHVCWKGKKVVGRHAWSIYTPDQAVSANDLEDHGPYNDRAGEGWREELTMALVDLIGKSPVKFSLSSASGCNVIRDLRRKMYERIQAGEAARFPLVTLDAEEFEAQGQTNWKPKIDVVGWVTDEQVQAYLAGEMEYDELVEGQGDAPAPDAAAIQKVSSRKRARPSR